LRHETNFSIAFDIPTHHAFRILKRDEILFAYRGKVEFTFRIMKLN